MRDYKRHTSRPVPSEPERPEAAVETEAGSQRRPRLWPWLSLGMLIAAVAVGWVIHSYPRQPVQTAQHAITQRPVAPASTTGVPAAVASASAPSAVTASPPLAAATSAAASPVSAATSSSEFTFYQILPKMQVDIPSDILGSGPGIPSSATTSTAAAANQPVTIQVGSFHNRAEAVVLRDRLALLGVFTTLQSAELPPHIEVFRLRTATYNSLAAAQPALAKIRSLGIAPLLMGATAAIAGAASPSGNTVSGLGPVPPGH
ncbi:SPOR domain-containing protein [Acidithiobacillus sp.]